MINWSVILPVIIYLILIYIIALLCNRKLMESGNFFEEYFIGSRSMGGFVLAMTLVATYTSASSFISGPGAAYGRGLGWVLLAMIQVPTAWFSLGVIGKKFAIVARRINAVTVNDFLKERYKSPLVVIIASVSLILFFIVAMTVQFRGGARLFEGITGLSYEVGLIIFAVTVIIYTTIGGFRAVVLTDALQGVVMMIGTLVLLGGIFYAAGGVEGAMTKLASIDKGLISPYGPQSAHISQPFMLSFWVLVCFGTIGLPHLVVRCMGYSSSRSLHRAMIIGTVVVSVIMFGMHLCGAVGKAIIPDLVVNDSVMPVLSLKVLSPVLAGIFLAGPLAGVMSTIDSQLILMSATVVKDIYVNYIAKKPVKSELGMVKIKRISFITTMVLGVIVFLASIKELDLIFWLNLFAFGGMQSTFLWPVLLGLYWKRGNKWGALASMAAGVISYFALSLTIKTFHGVNVIIPSLLIGLAAYVIGSLVTKKPDEETIELFWGE